MNSQIKFCTEEIDGKFKGKVEYTGFVGQPNETEIFYGNIFDTKAEALADVEREMQLILSQMAQDGIYPISGSA